VARVKMNERQVKQAERKRVQKIRKRANQDFLDFHHLDRNDPLFMKKYNDAIAKRNEQRIVENIFI
jgi:hypothetical protein